MMKPYGKYIVVPFILTILFMLLQISTTYGARISTGNLYLEDPKAKAQLERLIEENQSFLKDPREDREEDQEKREIKGETVIHTLNNRTLLLRLLSLRKDWLYQNALVDSINFGRQQIFLVGILLSSIGIDGFWNRVKNFFMTIGIGTLGVLVIGLLIHWIYHSTTIAELPITQFILENTDGISVWSPGGLYFLSSFIGLFLTGTIYGLLGYLLGILIKDVVLALLLTPILQFTLGYLVSYPPSPLYFWDRSLGILVHSGEIVGIPGKEPVSFALFLLSILLLTVVNFNLKGNSTLLSKPLKN